MDEQYGRTDSAATSRIPWRYPVTALAVAVLMGIGWAVLRPETSAVSDPVVSPSAPRSSDSSPVFAGRASITFNFDPRPGMPYRTARFDVQRSNDDLDFQVSFGGANGEIAAPSVQGAAIRRVWWFAPDKSLQVALVPGFVRSVASLGTGRIQLAYLANVDLAAIAIERDRAAPADKFFWSDYNGTVRDSRGAALTSATVMAGTSPVTVFEDSRAGVWGYFDDKGRVAEPITRAPAGTLRVRSIAESGDPGIPRLSWVGLLPAGATDVELTADDSVSWGTAALGRTGRVVIAGYTESFDNVRSGRTGVRSISYVDASGRRHSLKP